MLRLSASVLIAALCWTRSSFGFFVAPPASISPKPRMTVPSPPSPLWPSPRTTSSLSFSITHQQQSNSSVMVFEPGSALVEEIRQKEELRRRLPSLNRNDLSKHEKEFRELLEGMLYTPEEMSSVTNPRTRILYEGVAASYYEPAVYRAFEVLYEDYMPLRVAGRIVHGKLQKIMDDSKIYRRGQWESIAAATESAIAEDSARGSAWWDSFVRLAGDREMESARLEGLLQRRQAAMAPGFGGPASVLAVVNPTNQPSLSFSEVLSGLFRAASSDRDAWIALLDDLLDPETVEATLAEAEEGGALSSSSLSSPKDAKHAKRYDEMLVQFAEWKDFVPSGEGRRLDILRGCFVGSENPRVVEALRVIYTDYRALRLSGDWIFQVVSTLMKAAKRRSERR